MCPPEPAPAADSPVADSAHLWLLAVLGFGVGDLVTTSVGLGMAGVVEANPFVVALFGTLSIVEMVILKIGVFACFYLVWIRLPRPHAVGVPLGLILVGSLVTAWNVYVVVWAAGG